MFCSQFIVFIDSQVGYVWNFVGSIGGTLILYIFPALFYLRLRYLLYIQKAVNDNTSLSRQYCQRGVWRDCLAGLIASMGLVLLVVENYVSIMDIVGGNKSSLYLCIQHYCVENSTSAALLEDVE